MDLEAFKAMALAELPAVHRMARRLCGSASDADDLAQETFLRALRSWKQFTPRDAGIRPWLLTILYNLFRSALKRRRREHLLADPPESARAATHVDGIDWQQVDQRLKAAVDALPLPQRVVFLLHAVEELKYREIAEIVQVPIGTVMSRLHRARAALLENLGDAASRRPDGGRSAGE